MARRRHSQLDKCDPCKGGSRRGREDTPMCPSPAWAASSCHTRRVEVSRSRTSLPWTFVHQPSLPGLPRFFGASQLQALGRSSRSMPCPGAPSGPYISPCSGSLEKLEAESKSHASSRSRPQDLETGAPGRCKAGCRRVRVHACVHEGYTVHILLISLGNMGLASKGVGGQ